MHLLRNIPLQGGKYRIIRVLGQGGFGITYLAEHTMLDKMVAIKEFFPMEYCDRNEKTNHLSIVAKNSVEIVEMLKTKFIKEAKNISKINHRNIITIHDIFQENDTAYYVMEYVEGASLSQKIKEQGAMPEDKAIDYTRKIADAVGYMHTLSMNHLDLKPANIMVRAKDDEPILIDFGLSKQYDESGGQTSTAPVAISHGFAPAEQYRPGGVSSFTPQTDIYALGATLFNLLSGTLPPHYSEILEDGLPELPDSVSKTAIEAIEKAMEAKKAKRPASIYEFLAMLPINVLEPKKTSDTHSPIHAVKIDKHKCASSVEETVILNVPISDYAAKRPVQPYRIERPTKQPSDSSEMSYLNLGLSVKWATKLSGVAKPVMNDDVYRFELENGEVVKSGDFVSQHRLPSTKQFEELIERCSWTTFSENGLHGYKITGPNGNILMMPLGALNRYLSAECLKPDSLYYYFLYLGEYTHSLAKGVPTDANIWTVKE